MNLIPNAVEAMSREIDPDWWQVIDTYPDDVSTARHRKTVMDRAERYARAYLAVALPEAVSVEELAKAWHMGFFKGEQTALRERPVNPDTVNPYKNGEKP